MCKFYTYATIYFNLPDQFDYWLNIKQGGRNTSHALPDIHPDIGYLIGKLFRGDWRYKGIKKILWFQMFFLNWKMPHKTGFQIVEYVLFYKYTIISLFDVIHSMVKVINDFTNLGNSALVPKRKPTGNMGIFLLSSTLQPIRLANLIGWIKPHLPNPWKISRKDDLFLFREKLDSSKFANL